MSLEESRRAHALRYTKLAEQESKGWDKIESPEKPKFDDYADLKKFLVSPWLPSGGIALDVGCGGGQGSFLLANHWLENAEEFAICGIDFVPEAIAMAERNRLEEGLSQDAVTFGVCDIPSGMQDITDMSVDLIIDNHFFHCLVDQEKRAAYLHECARVLTQEGVFFLATMLSTNIYLPNYEYQPSPRNSEGFRSFQTKGRDELLSQDRYYVDQAELMQDLIASNLEPFFCESSEGDIALYARKASQHSTLVSN